MSEVVIYTTENGQVQLDINLAHDTLWLSQQQISDLFGTQRQAITKHLKNIFISGELEERSVCSKIEHAAKDRKKYKTKFYSLDAVNILKKHLIQGYTIHKPSLAE